MKKILKEKIINNIYIKYPPFAFTIDMGDHAETAMGVQESTHIRMATKEEQTFVNGIIKIIESS